MSDENDPSGDKLKDHEKWGQKCDCKLRGALHSVSLPCGHIQLISGKHGTIVDLSEARRFVDHLHNEIQVTECVGAVNEMIESIDAQLSPEKRNPSRSNRQQIWNKANEVWSGETIANLEQRQHELLLKCVDKYGDEAAARFKELSESLNQQLAADLLPNPDA